MKILRLSLCLVIVLPFIAPGSDARDTNNVGPGVWTRNGPMSINSGDYSLINDRSILAYGNKVWAGTNGDGLYQSTDGGQTWFNSSSGLPVNVQGKPSADAEHLVGSFSPYRAPRLYVTTTDVTSLYRSIDGGTTWTKVYRSGVPFVDSTTTSLFVAGVPLLGPLELPDKLWVSVLGYNSGIYYSETDGKDWAPFDPAGLPSTNCQVVSGKEGAPSHDPDYVFAACRSRTAGVGSVYRSLASPAKWFPANNGLPPNLDASVFAAANKDGTRRIYLGLTNNFTNGPVRIYRSDNNGDSWEAAANGLPANALVMDIAVDVRDSSTAYAALYVDGVYKTDDAGRTWRLFNNGLLTNSAGGIAVGVSFEPGPALVHLGTRGVWSISDINTGNCSVSLSEPVRAVPSWEEGYIINVSAASNCSWSTASNVPWITDLSPRSAKGASRFTFTVKRNSSSGSREGTITIGDKTLKIDQAAATQCEYNLPLLAANVPAGGVSENMFFLKTTSSNCSWVASSTVPWITVKPPLTGGGDAVIKYSVQKNDYYLTPRTGTISIGGQSFTVNQPDKASDPCEQQRLIAVGQTLGGSITPTDCQLDNYFDYYWFKGRAGQRIAIEMTAPSFFPELYFAPFGSATPPGFPFPDQHTIRYPNLPQVGYERLLKAGDYMIHAKSRSYGIGDYTIKLIDADSLCPPLEIGSGTFSGALANSDCGNGYGDFSDVFVFSGTKGQQITLSASSPTIDPVLFLYDENREVAADNNGGGGTTARIPARSGKLTLPTTGLYRIIVTTLNSEPKVGNYTLTFAPSRGVGGKKRLR